MDVKSNPNYVEYGENAGMDEASIREHEEVTKVKNVNKLELGRHMIDTWYFSPIPKDYYPDGPIDVLYFCEFSLNFYRFKEELTRHYKKCATRYPPGKLAFVTRGRLQKATGQRRYFCY